MEQSQEQLAESLAKALEDLAAGDDSARDRLVEISTERLRMVARRMLGRFPVVSRWDDTDDVLQNASLRLYRSLVDVRPDSPKMFLGLAITHLKRELLDLARRYGGPQSHAANHETNMLPAGDAADSIGQRVDHAVAPEPSVDRWTRFHEAIAALDPSLREVFELVWYAGVNQQTAANLLGCSIRTVKSRWRSAREAIRQSLDQEPPE